MSISSSQLYDLIACLRRFALDAFGHSDEARGWKGRF
jgi:hypothetical protein